MGAMLGASNVEADSTLLLSPSVAMMEHEGVRWIHALGVGGLTAVVLLCGYGVCWVIDWWLEGRR